MTRIKYPRTYHMPGSPGATNDDKILSSLDCFDGKALIITEKMDGENTTMTRDACYARSVDSGHHESRAWVKGLHGSIKHLIPDGWRICGENMFAKHSIYYNDLESYFLVFSIWDDRNQCMPWPYVVDFCYEHNLVCVPSIGFLIYPSSIYKHIKENLTDNMEGFVIRNNDGFHYDDFKHNVAKWVRKNHVSTDKHWMHQGITQNKLKSIF